MAGLVGGGRWVVGWLVWLVVVWWVLAGVEWAWSLGWEGTTVSFFSCGSFFFLVLSSLLLLVLFLLLLLLLLFIYIFLFLLSLSLSLSLFHALQGDQYQYQYEHEYTSATTPYNTTPKKPGNIRKEKRGPQLTPN